MNNVVKGLILYVVGWAAFHYGLFPLMTPKEPTWIVNRYVYYLLFVAYCLAFNLVLKLKPPISLNGLAVFLLGFYFYQSVLFPPIPWTLLITYMMLWGIGTFLYVSQDPATFAEFRKPIVRTVTGEYKLARYIVFASMPLLVGFGTYQFIYPSFPEPVELRTVHPAPPATTRVHGKNFTLEGLQNPFRIDEQDNYKDSFPFLDADKQEYMKSVTEGGTIFFREVLMHSKGYIEDFVVHKDYRGMGIGKNLAKYLLGIAKDKGVDVVYLTSGNQRKSGHALWKRLGFQSRDSTCFVLYL